MKFNKEDRSKSIIKVDNKEPCDVCKEDTEYIDFCYEVRVCSQECQHVLDKQANEWIENHKDDKLE